MQLLIAIMAIVTMFLHNDVCRPGVAVMLFLSFIDYHIHRTKNCSSLNYRRRTYVTVRFMGVEQGGAERWINLFGITFRLPRY